MSTWLATIQKLGALRLGFGRPKKLIGNVNYVIPYIIPHNSTNVLCRRLSGPRVIVRVDFIGEKIKGHACRYFKTMEERINPVFHG